MKAEATTMPATCRPAWSVELYRDPRGNWFAAVTSDGTSFTATFTTAREALDEATRVRPLEYRLGEKP